MPYEETDYAHGATIIHQGGTGGGFYILLAGAVEIFKDDLMLTTLMFPGTIFGEMADILHKPRSCTVKAKNSARIAFVKYEHIADLIREQPDVALKIMKALASRLERTTQKLADQTKESPMWAVQGVKKPLA
jgi:CRP/FNR family transcriptional regulator, cyclic AMP receptor protein